MSVSRHAGPRRLSLTVLISLQVNPFLLLQKEERSNYYTIDTAAEFLNIRVQPGRNITAVSVEDHTEGGLARGS